MSGTNGAAAPAAPAAPAAATPPPPADGIISRAADRPGPDKTISLSQGVDLLTRNRRREAAAAAATPPTSPTPPAAPAPAAPAAADPAPPRQSDPAPAAPDNPLSAFIDSLQSGATPPARTDAEPGTDPQQPTARGFDVVINGTAHRFTEEQIAEHFHKAQHFTQRAQAMAKQAEELAEARRTINELLPTMLPELQRQIAALEADSVGDDVDWERLAIEDPSEYARKHARLMMAQRERLKLEQLTRAQSEEQQTILRQQMQRSHERLTELLPGWSDPGQRQTIQAKLRAWGAENGFSARELDGVFDHRLIMTMTKASAFDYLMARSRENPNTPTIPAAVQRGAPPPQIARASAPVAQAQEAFAEKPSLRTGANLLAAQKAARQAAAARGRR